MGSAADCLDLSQVTLAALAGGMGRRMGQPKSMLRLAGQPILAWLLERWRWPGPTMLVMTPSVPESPAMESFDQRVVDPVDGLGPLRGIRTALEHARTPILLTTTVDMPAIERDQLAWLARSLRDNDAAMGVMCRVSEPGASRIEPFPSAFRATAADAIRQRIDAGRLSVQELCAAPAFIAAPAPSDWSADTWMNLNDSQDFQTFESSLKNLRTSSLA